MKHHVLGLFFVSAVLANGESPEPVEAYGIHKLGNFEVRVDEWSVVRPAVSVYFKDGTLLNRRDFVAGETESVGGYGGMLIPKVQPLPKAMILTKHGGYNGRTIIITDNGGLIDLPGGEYCLSADRKLLFSRHETDIEQIITVIRTDTWEIESASVDPKHLIGRDGTKISIPRVWIYLPEILESKKPKKS